MKKNLLSISVISLILASCTYKKGEIPEPVNIQACDTSTVIHTVGVTIGDNNFTSPSINIIQGDTVLWTYPSSGISAHTTTCNGSAGCSSPPLGTNWDSGNLNPGQTYKVKITVPGTYTYVCSYHTGMTGTINVKRRCN